MGINIRTDREMRAFMGLSVAEYERLLERFAVVYEARRQQRYATAVQAGQRKRKLCPEGSHGRKSNLQTMATKLLFVLYYYKVYPTFDVLGLTFNLSRSKAHTQLYNLSPLLHETLVQLEMMPAREFATVDELMTALDGLDQIVIDATAPRGSPPYHRPQEATAQQEHYSGKKTAYPEEYYHRYNRKSDSLCGPHGEGDGTMTTAC